MFNILKKSKKQNNSITSTLFIFGVNLLLMFLTSWISKKLNPANQKKIRDYSEGEIVD